MLGRRELVAAAVAALMAGLAVVGLAGLDDGDVVEVRVQGGVPTFPEQTRVGDTSTTSAPVRDAERVVWAEKGDVWLYDGEAGRRRRLTTDGVARHDSKPRFRSKGMVTYLTSSQEFGPDPAMFEFDLATGKSEMVRRLPGHIRAYDWSPDGNALAYYSAPAEDGATELHITGNGLPRLRRFAPIEGRGGFVNYDETRIEWSPNGQRLLLLDTALDTAVGGPSFQKTLYVLNADGTDAIAPGLGTWARWSADSRTIYCLCATHQSRDDCHWQAIDLTGGVRTPLLIPAGARASLSPDGLLAYDDGEDTPSVYVLDPRKPGSRPRFLARAAIAPIWLTPSRLAFTNTRPCPRTEDECMAGGHGSMFEPAGTAAAFNLTTNRRTPLPPIPTEGADTSPAPPSLGDRRTYP